MYKVLIASAGLGNRLKGMTKNVNKALVSVGYKPAISHIIEKFSKGTQFVIPVGYKSQSIKNFIKLAYPDYFFKFVDVDPFEGKGSGLGLSVLMCERYLQCPFIFSSNDTIVLEDIPLPEFNWVGQSETADNSEFRTIKSHNDIVKDICPKGVKEGVKAYIGLAGIKDYKDFWNAMNKCTSSHEIEVGESVGLRGIIHKNIKAIDFTWFDTGNISRLNKTRDYFSKDKDYNILDKEEEAIWFVNKSVIKFSTDKSFIKQRVSRTKKLVGFIPKIESYTEDMFRYKMVTGTVFSKKPTVNNFINLLNWLNKFWHHKSLSKKDKTKFNDICNTFYMDKTYERIDMFFRKFEIADSCSVLNGISVDKVHELLKRVDWDNLKHGVPVRFHGDLHFENILINENTKEKFTLLDWRQSFGGLQDYGDLYYDLGKLLHGLIVNHHIISENLFSIDVKKEIVEFDFNRTNNLVECELYFHEWLSNNGMCLKKVKIITALIFLNISALHHYPYSLLLFYLGKYRLHDALEN